MGKGRRDRTVGGGCGGEGSCGGGLRRRSGEQRGGAFGGNSGGGAGGWEEVVPELEAVGKELVLDVEFVLEVEDSLKVVQVSAKEEVWWKGRSLGHI